MREREAESGRDSVRGRETKPCTSTPYPTHTLAKTYLTHPCTSPTIERGKEKPRVRERETGPRERAE